MKIAIVMNDNSYSGREYASSLVKNGVEVDAILIGSYPEFNASENERCGGLWDPPTMDSVLPSDKMFRFSSLKDLSLKEFLLDKKYDLGIQGGTGILKPEIFGLFRLGMLNFHPGDLPKYRGCSAPEWQIYEGNPVVCTCHLIDSGIDSGGIVAKREIFQLGSGTYYEMRSQVYLRISRFLVDVINQIEKTGKIHAEAQDENNACYRKYIGDAVIQELKIKMERQIKAPCPR